MSGERTATERLRGLLDAMGVKWAECDSDDRYGGVVRRTRWDNGEYSEWPTTGAVRFSAGGIAPERAVAATIGGGTLTAEQVEKCAQAVYFDGYSDGSTGRGQHIGETDWQAIADELNGMLGSGTCKITATSTNNLMYPDYMTKWYELSCGHSLTLKGEEAPKWCAVCGKAVKR